MESHSPSPSITSFVIRFVHEGLETSVLPSNPPRAQRGSIRHIQSDREIAFTHWQEALEFIQSYIALDSGA